MPNYIPSGYKHRKSLTKTTNKNYFSKLTEFFKIQIFFAAQKIMAFPSRIGKFVLQRFKSSLLHSCSFRQNSITLQVRLCSSTKNNKPVTKEQRVHKVLDKMNRVNQYGTIGGVFHISLSTLCLGLLYVLFSK